MQIKPLISSTPKKSKENLYLHNGKIYQYTGEEGKVIEELTDEFKETTVDLSNILNLMAHITEDEKEYKVLCELSDKAYHLEGRIKKLNEELDEYKSYF